MAIYSNEDKEKLEAATPDATAETLALRDGAGGASFTQLVIGDDVPSGSPSSAVWLVTDGTRPTAAEPSGTLDGFAYADGAPGSEKFHRTYMGRATSSAGALTTALTISGSSLPSGDWSAHLTARIHAYDVSANRVHKLTREAGLRRTAGTIAIPSQTQHVGFDQNEGATAVSATIQLVSGNIVVRVLHPKISGVAWAVWAELSLVEH